MKQTKSYLLPDIYGYSAYLSRRQEDVCRLLLLMQCLSPDITFERLDAALTQTGLSPDVLYCHVSSGCYTPAMARLDEALGLPVKDVTVEWSDVFTVDEMRVIEQLFAVEQQVSMQVSTSPQKKGKTPYYHKNKQTWWR